MKRKTNLFYLKDTETNFITFSNYGESLTGDFLATDWKLYPTHFICMYCKFLDVDDINQFNLRKQYLTRYLAAFYENKLAFLRDYCIEHNINVENILNPLSYLLEALYRFNPDMLDGQGELHLDNEDLNISFVGDITEQDYNGTYTDIISFINSSDVANGSIKLTGSELKTVEYLYKTFNPSTEQEETTDKLYGWMLNNEWIGPSEYENLTSLVDLTDEDGKKCYSLNSAIELDLGKHSDNTTIKFNLLIPLYDLVNNNINTNATILEDKQKSDETYIKNMPLGIWFSNTVIDLKRDSLTHYAPSWSLLLSAQFKPFPYSVKMPNEISQDATKEAFATYSQVLTRQNKLLNIIEDMSSKIVLLEDNIKNLQSQLNHKSSYYVDEIQVREINFENRISHNMDAFKKEIYELIKDNKWKTDALV